MSNTKVGPHSDAILPFTPYQKLVVAILAFLQFTIILDFMIISPLGAAMMPALSITPSQFGAAVSAYAFSAGIAGFLAAGFADKYDRKKLLLFFYTGFMLGTLLCGLADSYYFLLGARIVTGLFGGVVGSAVMAITTDLFPLSIRGRVIGFIQTAFAASQILGLPIGLYLSNYWDWHAPFFMILIVGIIAGVVMFLRLKPVDAHLKGQADSNALQHLVATIAAPRYLFAFLATMLLSLGGFMLMPFSSAFLVNNVGVSIEKLPIIYLVTGICSMVVGPYIGRLSDRVGKYKTFVGGSVTTVILVVFYTHMGITPFWQVVAINALLFLGVFSRMIPSQALMSAVPQAKSRGAFMSISSSVQQVAGGFGSMIAGLIIVQNVDGTLGRFSTIGWVLVGTSTLSVFMMYFINRMVATKPGAGPVAMGH